MVGVKSQDQGWAISQIHLINYNFYICHRDFKLRSYFSLWKAAPNMTCTLIFDLDKLAKGQNFWNNNYGKLAKTCLDIMRTA